MLSRPVKSHKTVVQLYDFGSTSAYFLHAVAAGNDIIGAAVA